MTMEGMLSLTMLSRMSEGERVAETSACEHMGHPSYNVMLAFEFVLLIEKSVHGMYAVSSQPERRDGKGELNPPLAAAARRKHAAH